MKTRQWSYEGVADIHHSFREAKEKLFTSNSKKDKYYVKTRSQNT